MKQLSFVFAATAGIALAVSAADAATRYNAPSGRQHLYDNYDGCTYHGCAPAPAPMPVMTQVAPVRQPEPVPREEPKNTLALANPFFQPTAGRVGSLTDIGLATNSYDFEIFPGYLWGGISGGWEASELFIKEDLSIGITDEVALMGMVKYAKSEYEMTWSGFPTDSMSDSGISIWGLGLQWKFLEDSEWVSHVGAFFQSSDIANNLMLNGRVGYKTSPDTTIYGLANLAYVMWENTSYGNGITNPDGQSAYIAFETDASSSFYIEGGVGVFHELSDQWSINIEGVLGNYAWHSQLLAKAAIYWQPSDSFALGIYGKTSLWDSADSAEDLYIYSWCEPGSKCEADFIAAPPSGLPTGWNATDPYCYGGLGISNYRDVQLGAQLIIYF